MSLNDAILYIKKIFCDKKLLENIRHLKDQKKLVELASESGFDFTYQEFNKASKLYFNIDLKAIEIKEYKNEKKIKIKSFIKNCLENDYKYFDIKSLEENDIDDDVNILDFNEKKREIEIIKKLKI